MNLIFIFTEPNSFQHVFNYSVNATQLAKDFLILRKILKKYSLYQNTLLVGPDVTRPRPENTESIAYLKEFLKHDGGQALDAITFHQ